MNFKENQEFIWLEDEEGKRVAYVQFHEVKEGVLELAHTVVSEELKGKGIAGKLLEAFVKKLEKEEKRVIPTCCYAADWFRKKTEYSSLVEK